MSVSSPACGLMALERSLNEVLLSDALMDDTILNRISW